MNLVGVFNVAGLLLGKGFERGVYYGCMLHRFVGVLVVRCVCLACRRLFCSLLVV